MFRLRLSNNRLEDINTLSALTQVNRIKLTRTATNASSPDRLLVARNKSSNQKISIGSSNPKTSSSSRNNSSSYHYANNSLSSTPEKLLPVIKKSKKNSTSSTTTKRSLHYVKSAQPPSTTSDSCCDCIFCNQTMRKQSIIQLNSKDMFLIDSKNFVNCLNRMKPTIKLDRESQLNDLGYSSRDSSDFSSGSNNTLIKIKNNNQIIKLLPAQSRIKLWDQADVMNYISTEETRKVNKEPKKQQTKEVQVDMSNSVHVENESRLSKIFREFRINPNFSPLFRHSKPMVATIGFQDFQEPVKSIALEVSGETKKAVKVPTTIKTMPLLPKSPSNARIMYKVPMNSALAFYDC